VKMQGSESIGNWLLSTFSCAILDLPRELSESNRMHEILSSKLMQPFSSLAFMPELHWAECEWRRLTAYSCHGGCPLPLRRLKGKSLLHPQGCANLYFCAVECAKRKCVRAVFRAFGAVSGWEGLA
jgi:hypothetical protein